MLLRGPKKEILQQLSHSEWNIYRGASRFRVSHRSLAGIFSREFLVYLDKKEVESENVRTESIKRERGPKKC